MSVIILKNFKLNKEGKYSITKPCESTQITDYMFSFINEPLNNLIITDGTACVGGDTVNFSKHFKKVNSVEINKENYDLLKENCYIFGCKNVKLYNKDYMSIMDNLYQDVVYLDPKWGGPDYKSMENVKLYINSIEIHEIVNKINTSYLFIKVPLNAYLRKIKYNAIYTIYNRNKNPSFKLICIKK